MAFTQIQTATQNSGTGTSIAVTVSATVAGNLVVVHIGHSTAGGNGATSSTCDSVTDDKSNTYVVQAAVDSGTVQRCYQAYGVQVTGGTTTVTANFTGACTKFVGADEYSGPTAWANNADAFDVSTTGTSSGSTSLSVATLTPAATGELIAGTYKSTSDTWTNGTNYVLYSGTNPAFLRSQYRLSCAATETAPCTKVGNARWVARATAFKAAAVAAAFLARRNQPILQAVPRAATW